MAKQFDITRIHNDVNGNPRYVVHFLQMLTEEESNSRLLLWSGMSYPLAIARCAPSGGKKYHNKSYGGGVVFQSYNIQHQLNECAARFERTHDYVNGQHNMVLVVMNDFELYNKGLDYVKRGLSGKLEARSVFAEICEICRQAAERHKKRVSHNAVFIAACEVMIQLEEGCNS